MGIRLSEVANLSGFVPLFCESIDRPSRMNIEFSKFHGTGNDFIVIDNRQGRITLNQEKIAFLCHRRFGIGADGLMMLGTADPEDFSMTYYNADGKKGSLCGNGARCVTAFAFQLGIINHECRFKTFDGIHQARIESKSSSGPLLIKVSLQDVTGINKLTQNSYSLDTGSPHYVEFVDKLATVDVFNSGKKIRWDKRFLPAGINVNFVEKAKNKLLVGTFERGVEDVTLSCGTGVTAAAIAATAQLQDGDYSWNIVTSGGELEVEFRKINSSYTNVWLKGPGLHGFSGSIQV